MAETNTEPIERQDKGLPSIFARLTHELTKLVDAKLEPQGAAISGRQIQKSKDDLALSLMKKFLKARTCSSSRVVFAS
jgi:hypothetical protein